MPVFGPGARAPPAPGSGQGPSGRCLAVLPGAPPASPHLAKNGFEELRRGTSLSRRAGGESQERLSGWVTKCVGQEERSSRWPTGCRLVASSFGGFDRSTTGFQTQLVTRAETRAETEQRPLQRFVGFETEIDLQKRIMRFRATRVGRSRSSASAQPQPVLSQEL